MPLHLLHHKSWNVYSSSNIDRVRADEALSEKRKKEESEREELEAAGSRIDVLRAAATTTTTGINTTISSRIEDLDRSKEGARKSRDAVKLTGPDGHINLFPGAGKVAVKLNTEREPGEKPRECWDSHALGRPEAELNPWYAAVRKEGGEEVLVDRRGRRRDERKERKLKDWSDPLTAMRSGVRRMKELEEAKDEWKSRREREVGGYRRYRRRDKRDEERKEREWRSRSQLRPHGSKEDSLAKLRAERDRREVHEREKTRELLRREEEKRVPGWEPVQGGRYSRQFGEMQNDANH